MFQRIVNVLGYCHRVVVEHRFGGFKWRRGASYSVHMRIGTLFQPLAVDVRSRALLSSFALWHWSRSHVRSLLWCDWVSISIFYFVFSTSSFFTIIFNHCFKCFNDTFSCSYGSYFILSSHIRRLIVILKCISICACICYCVYVSNHIYLDMKTTTTVTSHHHSLDVFIIKHHSTQSYVLFNWCSTNKQTNKERRPYRQSF